MNFLKRYLLLLLPLFWLIACHSLRDKPPRQEEVRGRFSLMQNKIKEVASGRFFYWSGKTETGLEISTPFLGKPIAKLLQHGQETMLCLPQNPPCSPDGEALFVKRFGFSPPLASLAYWLKRQADPRTTFTKKYDAENRLLELEQNGWRVEYRDDVIIMMQQQKEHVILKLLRD